MTAYVRWKVGPPYTKHIFILIISVTMPAHLTRRQFSKGAGLTLFTLTGCLEQTSDQKTDGMDNREPLPKEEYEGTDIHQDSAFSVYNNDDKEYTAKIRLTRLSTEEVLLDGVYLIPKSTGQRVTSLASSGEYHCSVSLNEITTTKEYEANRGQELALRIRDGEPKLFTSYLE